MRLRLTSRAHRELEHIAAFLIERNPQAARGFIATLDGVFDRLQDVPHHGRPTSIQSVRLVILPHYPFKVFYRVAGETIEVLSIFHTSQAPDQELE